MMFNLEALAPWATAGFGTGAGFLVVKWFVEWLSGRWDQNEGSLSQKRNNLDASINVLIEALQHQVADQEVRIARVEQENEKLRQRVDRQRTRETSLEEENQDLRDQLKAVETRLAALESIFKTLPASPELQALLDKLDETAPRRNRRTGKLK